MTEKLDKILISYKQPDFQKRLADLRRKKAPAGRFAGYESKGSLEVLKIIQKVADEGDKAVADYTYTFDEVELTPEQFKVSPEELEKAHKEIEPKLLASICQSIENVRKYQKEIFVGKNKECSSQTAIKYTPIKMIGICVPGAAAPLPSTVIMTAVPAIVAGVKPEDIVVVSPPRYKKSIHPVTLAVCNELKIKNVYRIGGAQAIAALACEKGSIPKVDKIVGPGNQWVQTAKKMVSQDYVGIDSIAGPSEVLIIANEKANPAWVAADMLSQAEHEQDSSALVITNSETLAKQILEELKNQLGSLSRTEYAEKSLLSFGAIVVFDDMNEVINLANDLAAEHLQIQCGDESRKIAEKIENAGALFIGDYTPVAVGDYWAGPSHTLPTEMRAKYSSALTSNDFIKSISIIEYDKNKLAQSAEDIIRLAQAEGLDAHAKSIEIRQNK
ncbi:MAG: histidinol dehydrogenase [Planctomycetota bacterium]|jgi:histidinol dehydrogenase